MSVKQVLPVEAYTSQEWFDKEQQLIFGRNWHFAGMVEDVAKPGDYQCHQVGPYHLVVIRGEDNTLRAFHNQCRHRGTQILEGRGQLEQGVRCPYHNWFYTFEGDLKAYPQKEQFPDLQKEAMGLFPAELTIWKQMIFIHPEPEYAEPFAEFLGDIEKYMGPHQPEKLVEVDRTRFEFDSNWKVFIENYMDGYHLQHLHSNSIKEYDHSQQSAGYVGKHWVFYEPPSEYGLEHMGGYQDFPRIDHIPDDKLGAYVHMMFPNLGITESETTWMTLEVIPLSPTRTAVDVRTRAMPFNSARYLLMSDANKQRKSKTGDKNIDRFKVGDVMQEDIVACEAIQKSMSSPKFQVGALAKDFEVHLSNFQKWIKQAMEQDL